MTDKKWKIIAIALIIVVFLVLMVFVAYPQGKKYIETKKVNAQIEVINAIMSTVAKNGYIVINNDTSQMILIEYKEPQ